MKKLALLLTLTGLIFNVKCSMLNAQTLNVTVGSVTYQFPAAQAGDMTYADGQTLTIMGKVFAISDITTMYVDDTEVTDNQVSVVYTDDAAHVYVPGNVALYVDPSVEGAHISMAQSTDDEQPDAPEHGERRVEQLGHVREVGHVTDAISEDW